MSKTYKLDWDADDMELLAFAVLSHQKDYKIAWAVNKAIHIDLVRVEDYYFEMPSKQVSSHACFKYTCDGDYYEWFLLENKGTESFLLPEIKNVSTLLIASGSTDLIDADEVLKKLKEISFVLGVFEIDSNTSKSLKKILL